MRLWPMFLLLLVPLSGCLVEDVEQDGRGFLSRYEERPEPTREEGQVTVQFEPERGAFVARQEIRVANIVPEDTRLDLHAQTHNGDIDLRDTADHEYVAMAGMWASGSTEEEARAHLETLRFMNTDEGRRDVQVRLWVEAEEFEPGDLPLVQTGVHARGVDIDITVPQDLPELGLASINGDIEVDVVAERVTVETTNGEIDASVRARDISLETTNGDIFLQGTPEGSGRWVLDATNGDLEAKVTTTDRIGYDLRLDTTNGDIEVDVDDVERLDEGHYRTSGWGSRAIQVRLEGDTTNGDVTVRG